MRVGELSMYNGVSEEERKHFPFNQVDFDAEVEDPGPVTPEIQALHDLRRKQLCKLVDDVRQQATFTVKVDRTEADYWINLKLNRQHQVVVHKLSRFTGTGKTGCGRSVLPVQSEMPDKGVMLTRFEVDEFGKHARFCQRCVQG